MANIFDLFRQIEKPSENAGGAPEFLLVGLGNPGAQYALTRHNAGFLTLDAIAHRVGARVERARFRALVGEGTIASRRVLFLKPQTFMNLSGEAVREAAAFYHIPPERVIVLADDVNFPVGRVRVRPKGSDGGHNGLKNIIYQLNSDAFPRVKIGVGEKPHPDFDLADWVLSAFTEAEQKTLAATAEAIFSGVEKIVAGDVAGAMQLLNGK